LKPDDSFIYPFYDTSNIRLGLNAVGGDSIHALLYMMTSNPDSGTGATIVTYGNMSKQPFLTIDPSYLIFRHLNFTGFWYSRWMVQQQYQQYLNSSICVIDNSSTTKQLDLRSLMMNEIVDAVLQGSVKCPPVQAYPLCDYKSAFEQSRQQINIKPKIVFDCRE
jgi:NADPH:quinone reductase-like Zn-dependent oxidoreductase